MDKVVNQYFGFSTIYRQSFNWKRISSTFIILNKLDVENYNTQMAQDIGNSNSLHLEG